MPQLTPFFFKQGPNDSLADVPRFNDGPARVIFKHIVHTYTGRTAAEMAAQSFTFATIQAAARMVAPMTVTSCIGITFPEDAHLVPAECVVVPGLKRVVTDIASFAVPRQLPLLFDIIELGVAVPDQHPTIVDARRFIILTNADIHLQPYFYLTVTELIKLGYDVITVNRRIIDQGHIELLRTNPALMLADYGNDHPGFDCFIFPESLFALFVKNNACVGAGMCMRGLLYNLAVNAQRFLMLTRAHLTFHIGDEYYWADSRFEDYIAFNYQQSKTVAATLAEDRNRGERLVAFMRANGENPDLLPVVENGPTTNGRTLLLC